MISNRQRLRIANWRRHRERRFGRCDDVSQRSGLTLFEVLLALAIFAGSLAALGQMMSNGVRGAVQARLHSQAVLRCQSKLAELTSGVIAFQTVSKTTFPDDPSWTWSLNSTAATQPGLFMLELTVDHVGSNSMGDVSFTLRRMARDPGLATSALLEGQAEQAASSSGSSSSSTGSSSSNSGSSGSGSGSSGSGSMGGGSSGSGSSGSGSSRSGSGSSGSGSSGAGSSGSGSSSTRSSKGSGR